MDRIPTWTGFQRFINLPQVTFRAQKRRRTPFQSVDTPAPVDNKELIRRFLGIVWPYRWYLLPALLCMVVLAASQGAMAFLVQPVMDRVFIQQDRELFHTIPLMVLGVFLVRGTANFLQGYIMEFVGHKIGRSMQIRMYNHLLTLEMGYFLNFTTGSFISRISNDAIMLKGAASTVMTGVVKEGLTFVVLVGVLIYRDPVLAAIACLGLPLSGLLIYKFGRRIRKLSTHSQEMSETVITHLEETFSGLTIVKAFCMEPYERARFRMLTKKLFKNYMRAALIRCMSNPVINMITGVMICGVILYGAENILSGRITTGAFFSFLTALMMTYSPVKSLMSLNNTLQQGLAAAQRIFTLLDTQPRIRDAGDAAVLPNLQRELSFNNVSFSYGDGLPEVLKEITLTVRAGERVALVGRSGSGKSTLVRLVPRFFDPTTGSVTLDGVDIRQATLKSLRDQIAVVTQEIILFNDTLLHNISYGNASRPMAEIEAAAEAANASEFIRDLPQGYQTSIGDRGVKLSGGQRQRLSIARSILKNAPILILDEATSSLDSESEQLVQEALDALMANRTTLIIAHRLSTIRSADRIVVLREGRICEEGTHDQLIARGGEYARLYAIQFGETA